MNKLSQQQQGQNCRPGALRVQGAPPGNTSMPTQLPKAVLYSKLINFQLPPLKYFKFRFLWFSQVFKYITCSIFTVILWNVYFQLSIMKEGPDCLQEGNDLHKTLKLVSSRASAKAQASCSQDPGPVSRGTTQVSSTYIAFLTASYPPKEQSMIPSRWLKNSHTEGQNVCKAIWKYVKVFQKTDSSFLGFYLKKKGNNSNKLKAI